jgi:hypothetical protein
MMGYLDHGDFAWVFAAFLFAALAFTIWMGGRTK